MAWRNFLRSRRCWGMATVAVIAATLLPLALARPQPTAEAADRWVSSARVSPSQVSAGETVAITAWLTAPQRRTVLIDLEVHNAAGEMVARRLWDRQTFADGQTREYRWNWTVPVVSPPGRYTVQIGVVGLRWNVRYWNGEAAAFDVMRVGTTTSSTTSTTTSTTTSSTTTTTVSSSTTSTTSSTTTTTTTMPPIGCDVPMETPIGALPPAIPMLCDTLATGVASTFVNGTNSWVDEFDHGASMAEMGPGYLTFERSSLSGSARTGHFRHNQHWMVDVYAPGQTGGAQMRPDRSFRFENGKLVVEAVIAVPNEAYHGFAWPEITVTTASSPASSAAGRVGPTPGRSIGDDLYAYGQFGGYDSVGIRLTGPRPIAAYYDDTERGFPCGRVWEISWFQNGESSGGGCTHPRQFDIWGGGEWVLPSGSYGDCDSADDPDTICRNLYRWELSQSKITLYINGRKLMEHTALPGVKALADQFVNSPVYVYFSDWIYQPPNRVVRYHWDRVAINP
jgi:hypothetical protein